MDKRRTNCVTYRMVEWLTEWMGDLVIW